MKRFSIQWLLIIAMSLGHCTRNPIGDNKIKPKNLSVSGSVQLSDAAIPAGVYIWLEGFNISTLTDSSGQFSIKLPPPEMQAGGGITGMFKLYYYVANYKFAVINVAVVDGSFVYGESAINNNGRIAKQTLKKLVDIETSVTPAIFPQDSAGYLRISVAFRRLSEPIDVTAFHERSSGAFAGVIFLRKGAPILEAKLELTSIWPTTETIDADTNWNMYLFSRDAELTAATYEIFPYIFIVQKDLPVELLQSIGQGYEKWHWHTDYLKIPIRQKTAMIKITE